MKGKKILRDYEQKKERVIRRSGVLMPLASLPGPFGIGCFSGHAYAFVDFLEKAGQSAWQILPLGPLSYGDSPYQSFSTFAGNPYFIDPETLVEEGLLKEQECRSFDFGSDPECTDYEKLYRNRFRLLKIAHNRFKPGEEYDRFIKDNRFWLDDYVLFMSLKDSMNGIPLSDWPEDIRLRKKEALDGARRIHENDMEFYRFQQYEFFRQWKKLKAYANGKGIQIIGDLPIYVAYDSADVWANPSLFQMGPGLVPTCVAGCPPDFFSTTGQLWGNPLYEWDRHIETGYSWWIERIRKCFELYDVLRIDHFRAFAGYYSIPFGSETAEHGNWIKGPGYQLFSAVRESLGNKPIIAENLGFITPDVDELLVKCGFPGMKVLQFAFDPWDDKGASEYLPHNYERNSVVYTGTHDNDTTAGWYASLKNDEKKKVRTYLRVKDRSGVCAGMIHIAMGSVSELSVIPIQDWLELGSEARINIPSTLGGNWCWRMSEDALTDSLALRIREMTARYGRLG